MQVPNCVQNYFNEITAEIECVGNYRLYYNTKCANGIELFTCGDFQVVLESHYAYEELYLSIWYEPQDFSQRQQLIERTFTH
jgi:hypothetical protein